MTTTQTPPPRQVNLAWRIGSTELQTCGLADADGTLALVDITKVEFRMKDSAGAVVLQLSSLDGDGAVTVVTGPAAVIEISRARVAALTVGEAYSYGIRLWTVDGRQYEQQNGDVSVDTSIFADEDTVPADRAYQVEAIDFFTRQAAAGGATLTNLQKNAFDDVYIWGKRDGWLPVLDALFPLFAIDDKTSLVNMINGSWTLTKSGAPVHTVGSGWAGLLAGAGFLQSNFNPTTAGGRYSLNSAHIGAWLESGAGNSGVAGGDKTRLIINQATGVLGGRINDASTSFGAAAGDLRDHAVCNRTGASALSRALGAVKYSVDTTTTTALDNVNWTICGNDNIASYSDARLAIVHWGGALTDIQIMSMRACFKAFFAALGSPIVTARNYLDAVNVGTLVPGISAFSTQNAGKAWSYIRDGQKHTMELRDGDLWGGSTERSELVSGSMFLNNVDTWLSFAFRWRGVQSGAWHVQGQFHAPDSGPTAGYSPVIGLDVNSNGVLSLETNYNIGAGQVFVPYATGLTMVPDVWYPALLKFKANAATPGTSTARLTVAGIELLNLSGINIGFNNDAGAGFYPKIGVYRDAATGNTTEIWEFENLEISTSSLDARISTPLPIYG